MRLDRLHLVFLITNSVSREWTTYSDSLLSFLELHLFRKILFSYCCFRHFQPQGLLLAPLLRAVVRHKLLEGV